MDIALEIGKDIGHVVFDDREDDECGDAPLGAAQMVGNPLVEDMANPHADVHHRAPNPSDVPRDEQASVASSRTDHPIILDDAPFALSQGSQHSALSEPLFVGSSVAHPPVVHVAVDGELPPSQHSTHTIGLFLRFMFVNFAKAVIHLY